MLGLIAALIVVSGRVYEGAVLRMGAKVLAAGASARRRFLRFRGGASAASVAVGFQWFQQVVQGGEESRSGRDHQVRSGGASADPGDDRTGLFRDQASRGQVPGGKAALVVTVDESAGNRAEVERRGTGPSDVTDLW